jgi:hypothetical protein
LAVALESTDSNAESIQLFNIPVSAEDMAPNIEILVEVIGEQDKLLLKVWREVNGKQAAKATVFDALSNVDPGCASTRGRLSDEWNVLGRAFAQAVASETEIIQRLQSDDVFTRREARIALSKRGENAFELTERLLARDDNYRLQLGALVALAGMTEDQRKKSPTGVIEKVRELRNSRDKTMRDTAVEALQEPAICYQEEDTNKQAAGRFLVMCYWTKEQCDRTRGPNTRPGVTQSTCEPVQLAGLSWKYATGGFAGAWYQYSPSAFGPPFPAVRPQPR